MPVHGRLREKVERSECVHVGKEVKIRSRIVYPIGFLRGDTPRITDRKCDQFADCHLLDKSACPMGLIHFATIH
jgi:hypothetical protein